MIGEPAVAALSHLVSPASPLSVTHWHVAVHFWPALAGVSDLTMILSEEIVQLKTGAG
jgi:hypothetical protein